jgi:plastocyanin
MTRAIFAVVALLALATAPVADPHPGHGATFIVVGQLKYSPATVSIYTGDSVLWIWNSADTDHSVTADEGQSMDFDSDAGKQPEEVSHPLNDGYGVTFSQPGTYRYHCKVHPFMTGVVEVKAAPVTPAPTLAKVSARPARFCTRCARPGTTVRLTAGSAGTIRATLRRHGKAVKEIDFPASAGANSKRLRFRNVPKGRYTLRLVAIDNTTGRASKASDLAVVVTG